VKLVVYKYEQRKGMQTKKNKKEIKSGRIKKRSKEDTNEEKI
jgi:hypothetical protein